MPREAGVTVRATSGLPELISSHIVDGPGWQVAVHGSLAPETVKALAFRLAKNPKRSPEVTNLPWAAALVHSDGTVVLATSPMQRAGFFWAADASTDGYVFSAATDPRAVVERRPKPTNLDRDWLHNYVQGAQVRPTSWSTPFEGIHRIPAGDTLMWNPTRPLGPGNPLAQEWPLPVPREWWNRPDDAVAEYRHRLVNVVEEILSLPGPLVAELSGGLDSTTAVAAAAASAARDGRRILACTSVPLTDARMDSARRVVNEVEFARDLARHYRAAVEVMPISNDSLRQPLDAAAAAWERSWLPCFSPTNQVWMDRIREVAKDLGAEGLLVGSHGNWSFSRNGSPVDWRTRLNEIGRRRFETLLPEPRLPFLRGLTGHSTAHAAIFHPRALDGVWRFDPYASWSLIEVAARLTRKEWGMEPWPRGFARNVAQGRVPDSIRLRRSRGAQAPDVWTWIKDQQDRYRHEVELLADTEILDGAVDLAWLRTTVTSWPWGEAAGPKVQSVNLVNRVLALGGYVRTMQRKLDELSPR